MIKKIVVINGGENLIYVMSDIHGMYNKYKDMLKLIQFSHNDTLYVLGDVVDRGNDSIKILLDMMQRDNVYGIIGNHEFMAVECLEWLNKEITDEMIDNLGEEKITKLADWLSNGGRTTLKEYKSLTSQEKEDLIEYLKEWTLYEEVDVNNKHYILVHAGLGNFDINKSLDDYSIEDLVWDRPDFEKTYYKDQNTYVIVGHTPTLSISGKSEIYRKNNIIDIDTGACFSSGKLSCLCLDTNKEYYI